MFALVNKGLDYVDLGFMSSPHFSLGDFNAPGITILDLSTYIPVGTKLVLIRVTVIEDTGNKQIFICETTDNSVGYNTLNTWTQGAGLPYGYQGFVHPTADRTIEVRLTAGTWSFVEIMVQGYFK